MTEREFALEIVQRLRAAGHETYWAGGCVRDELLGLIPADYDVATAANPDQVRSIFKRTIEVGLSFGVVEVLGPKQLKVQIATFRSDGVYSDGRRPDSVTFSSAQEDAKRRDFTINGMFFDPIENRVIDFVGGQADLQTKLLRAIGDPFERFKEDKLRMLRAVRIAARFSFSMEAQTAEAIQAMAGQILVVSPERIAEELRKILSIGSPQRESALRYLFELKLGPILLPESADERFSLSGVLREFGNFQSRSFPAAFALLFRFLASKEGAKRAAQLEKLCRRLKFSNEERERIVWLVETLSALEKRQDRPLPFSFLQPILNSPGQQELIALLIVVDRPMADYLEAELQRKSPEELDPLPLLTGEDLLQAGIPQGPLYKQLLQSVRDKQLDGEIKNRTDALVFIKQSG